MGWGVLRLILRGKPELKNWLTRTYPFVVLLSLYACFSGFTFLFVALDYRIDPDEHGIVGGVFQIAKNSFVSEKLSASESGPELRKKIQEKAETVLHGEVEKERFGRGDRKGREGAKRVYIVFAFLLSVGLLGILEFLRHLFSRSGDPDSEEKPANPDREVLPIVFSTALLILMVGLLGVSVTGTGPARLPVSSDTVDRLRDPARRLSPSEGGRPQSLADPPDRLPLADRRKRPLGRILRSYLSFFPDVRRPVRQLAIRGSERFGARYLRLHRILVRPPVGEYRLWGPWWFYLARLLIYEYAFLLVSAAGW